METGWLALLEMPLKIGAVFAAYLLVVGWIARLCGANTKSDIFGALVFASFLVIATIVFVVVDR
jgi:hypothetical protein